MKNYIYTVSILFFLFLSTAKANDLGTDKTLTQVKSKYANVKVYEQASTSTPIIAVLQEDESISYLRTSVLNGGGWAIVYVNGRPGYVLTAEIYDAPKYVAKKKKKSKSGGFSIAKKSR